MTRSERASKIRVAPELSARTLTATQCSRTIAFTRATKFRETFGLGFTLCSLARVSRRDRRHLGLPPYTAVYSIEPLVASAAETLGDEYDREEQTERWLTSRRGSETRWQPSATLEYVQVSILEATDVYRRAPRCLSLSRENYLGYRDTTTSDNLDPSRTQRAEASATANDLARVTVGC